MAKQQAIQKELADLQTVLARFPDGASIEMIQSMYPVAIAERTLQRRLATLQQQGVIRTTGQSRAILYHLTKPTETVSDENNEKATDEKSETIVPLSTEAQAIQKFIQQPAGNRTPKGYDLSFMRNYRPNIDAYLTEAERVRLLKLGQTPQLNQPAGTYARQILQRLLIDLSWNSSRLEGNTYSLLDTQRLLSQGQEADNKSGADAQMILNHKDAIEFLVESVEDIGFNRYTITNLHALLSNNLLPDPGAPGRLRTFAVGITNSAYTPLAVPQQIEEVFDLLLAKADQIQDPFEQAFFIMVQLPYLQPFEDVNKRVSRLAANISLNKRNLVPLSFVDVPKDPYIQGLLGVYELQRVDLLKDVFLWAYERSSLRYSAVLQSLGEPDAFRLRYRDDIRSLIANIVSQAMSQASASQRIVEYSARVPEADRPKFIEVLETELLSLHEGNFARYRIRPSEFTAWQAAWNGNGA
jgi:Fic family protein